MKIISLVENTSKRKDLFSEHGLSLYIETNGLKILFDMGQTDCFKKNAEKLGVDLENIDCAVLSHGHYDHGGGIEAFLKINKKASVYLSKYAFEEHYNSSEKYIGLNRELESCSRFLYVNDKTIISKDITIYTSKEIIKKHNFGAYGLKTMQGDKLITDDFRHEIYLEVFENGKRFLFSGCSHNGIMDIMDRFRPDYLIGGFHFSKITDKELLRAYSKYLEGFNINYFTCHCTGVEQFECMKDHMSHLFYLSTGDEIII